MRRQSLAVAFLLSLVTLGAHAEVKEAAPDHLLIQDSRTVHAPPDKLYAALVDVGHWWNGEHTYSGDASHLSLKDDAGGCFCERWKDGGAEHGHVVMALPGKLLRVEAALGPLQEFALKGILSFWVRGNDDGSTRIDVEYRVNGAAASGLDALAPQVDEMLGTQVARLKRYLDTGNPDEPPQAAEPTPTPDALRAAMLEQWKREAEAAKAGEAAKAAPDKPARAKPKRAPAPKP